MRTIKQGNKYISEAPKSRKAVIHCFIFVGTRLNHAISKGRSSPLKAIIKIPIRIEVKVSSLTAAEMDSAYRTEENPEIL